MTSRDPNARPVSARQALARLERSDGFDEPTRAFEPSFVQPPGEPAPPSYTRIGSQRSRFGAAAAILGVLAAVLIVAVVVLSGGGEGRGRAHAAKQAKAKKVATAKAETTAATETTAAVPSSTEPDPARGAELNEQGYALMQAGEYEAAVPVLEDAVAAFPEGSEDLNYAYALFNLGSALRRSGRAEEAIPILERRLEIPNQTGTVQAELEAARAEAGGGGEAGGFGKGGSGGEEGD